MGANNSTSVYNDVDLSQYATKQELDDAAAAWSAGYTPKGPASVSTINGLTGQQNGDVYTLTDGGTVNPGSLNVSAGDQIAWDATNSVWYFPNDYVTKTDVKKIIEGNVKNYDTNDLTIYKGSLGNGYWNLSNASARHTSVKLYAGQSVTLTNIGSVNAFYAVFPSSFTDGDKTHATAYPSGVFRVVLNYGDSVNLKPLLDCVLVMNVVDGASDPNRFTCSVVTYPLYESITSKTGVTLDRKETLESANLQAFKASLGNGVFYMPSLDAQMRHCSIRCKAGQYVEITNLRNVAAFYALFPSSFTDGDKPGNTAYPTGYNRITIGGNATDKITLLEDCVLVMNVVDGANDPSLFRAEIFDLSSSKINLKSSTNLCRLKIAEWNVGHFSMGSSSDTTIAPEQKAEKQAAYRSIVNGVGADILILCENNVNFCTDGTKANDAVWNCFNEKTDGSKNGYNMNSVLSNGLKIINKIQNLYINQDAGGGRYYMDVKYLINGKDVHVISTHNTWGDKDVAMAQYNELISYCSGFEYVILAGDFNASSQWDYSMIDVVAPLFHAAGFTSSWCDYMGAVDTYPASEYQPANLDNIFVKGFSVTKSNVVDSSIDLSDHKMIVSDIIMRS